MRQIRPRFTVVLLLIAAVLGTSSARAQQSPASSSFAQLDGEPGCLLAEGLFVGDVRPTGCGSSPAIASPNTAVVSPDGRQVYVASGSLGTDGVSVFHRDGVTGGLSLSSCVTNNAGDGRPASEGICSDGDALGGASGLALSPDGRFGYVSANASSAVDWFTRDATTGALIQQGCIKNVVLTGEHCLQGRGMGGASDVAVSPDGRHVYVAASRSNAIVVFARNGESGALTPQSCVSESGTDGACARVPGLIGVDRISLPGDGRDLYLIADGVLAALKIDVQSGDLSFDSCLTADAPHGGPCASAPLLAGATDLTTTPDGRQVLVVTVNSDADPPISLLLAYGRDGATGKLAQQQCLQQVDAQGDDATAEAESNPPDLQTGCEAAKAISAALGVASSTDGRGVFVVADGSLAAFQRDPTAGTLTEFGCAEEADFRTYRSCTDARGLSSATAVAASPDARNVYATSDSNDIAVFGASVAVTTTRTAADRIGRIRVHLRCPGVLLAGCSGTVATPNAASRRFRVRPGGVGAVRLRISSRSAQALRTRGHLVVVLIVRDQRRHLAPTSHRVLLRWK